jgi:hypothetical protein
MTLNCLHSLCYDLGVCTASDCRTEDKCVMCQERDLGWDIRRCWAQARRRWYLRFSPHKWHPPPPHTHIASLWTAPYRGQTLLQSQINHQCVSSCFLLPTANTSLSVFRYAFEHWRLSELYLNIQLVPRSKHPPSWLYNQRANAWAISWRVKPDYSM